MFFYVTNLSRSLLIYLWTIWPLRLDFIFVVIMGSLLLSFYIISPYLLKILRLCLELAGWKL